MCGEELLDQAQIEAAIAEAGRRLGEILAGNVEDWALIGAVPEGLRGPDTIKATYTPPGRICSASGHLACPLHGPFRPVTPLPPLRMIGGS